MTSTTKLLATLTLTLAAAVPAASAQTAPPPRLAQAPVLFVDPSLGGDTVAIAFRTDTAVAHKGKGTLDGGAGRQGAAHSIMTFSNTRHCYLSFLGPRVKLHVGHRYAVDVELAGTTVTRRVTLQKRTTERAVRQRLGCCVVDVLDGMRIPSGT